MIHVMYSMNEAYTYHIYKYVGVCFDGVCEPYTYIYIRTPTDRLRMCIAVVSGGGRSLMLHHLKVGGEEGTGTTY